MTWWLSDNHLVPSLKFNFKVEFTINNPEQTKVAYRVKDVTLPSFQKNVDAVLLGSKMVRQEGAIQWQPIKISFYDTDSNFDSGDQADSIALGLFNTGRMLLGEQLDFGEFDPSKFENQAKLNLMALGESDAFAEIKIYKLFGLRKSPEPDELNRKTHAHVFTIKNPILTGISFGDLDYSSEETNLITVDIEYDSCEMTNELF